MTYQTIWQILNTYQILIIQNIEKQITKKWSLLQFNNDDFLVYKIA